MLCGLALSLHAAARCTAEVLDRIAVTVDKQVIAESDLIRYLRVAAFLDAKARGSQRSIQTFRGGCLGGSDPDH